MYLSYHTDIYPHLNSKPLLLQPLATGIHGNENTNVKIAAVEFRDFEVAAVSLNNVDTLEISDCDIVQNRHDVPVVGLFSAARFLR